MNDMSLAAILPARIPLAQLLRPRLVKIGADGNALADDAIGHVAVLLPDFGLMFTAATIGQAETWAEAKEMAAGVQLLGQTDWVLPEAEELALLVRRDRSRPSIDAAFFPETRFDDWYWSATPLASSPSDFAWGVGFNYGDVSCGSQVFGGFVRAVRRVPAGQ
ncbi:MAG TPA: DUF1566 domain-containing protein [Nevskia sp.]|nr:DUF1566 domain-containing protein [Nevskia sp.]